MHKKIQTFIASIMKLSFLFFIPKYIIKFHSYVNSIEALGTFDSILYINKQYKLSERFIEVNHLIIFELFTIVYR